MQRQEYKRQMSRISPDELLLARTEAAMRKQISAIKRRRTPLRVMLVAALALILMAGIAFASGLLESVFLQMKGRYTTEDVNYEAVHQAAAKDVFDQAVELPGAVEPMQFTIKESYYDGETLMLGFTYTVPPRPASFDFGRDHAYFSRLEPLESLWYIKDALSEAEYQQYESELKQSGKVGILLYETYMSDGVYGEGGEEEDLNIGQDARDQLPDGTQWRMLEIEPPLPEALVNQDEIGIQFKVVQWPVYYYEDQTGKYWYRPFEDRVVVPLTALIARSDVETQRYTQDFANGAYSVRVDALVAPAYVKATFTLDVPKEWRDAAREEVNFTAGGSPVDYVSNFIMVGHGTEVDGELIESGVNFMNLDFSEMSGTYPPLSVGDDKLIFRPVYVNSGAHPDEDMIIQITP